MAEEILYFDVAYAKKPTEARKKLHFYNTTRMISIPFFLASA